MSRPLWRHGTWRTRAHAAGWPALAALALAAIALTALSVHAVMRETASRRQVLTDTYRGIADLASARVSERLTAAGNALHSIVNEPGDGLANVAALSRYEESQPWAAPIVLLPRSPNSASTLEEQVLQPVFNPGELGSSQEHVLNLMGSREYRQFRGRPNTMQPWTTLRGRWPATCERFSPAVPPTIALPPGVRGC
jgi:hypothetical protein